MVEGEARPVMTRAGSMIAQQWRRFGIDATTDVGAGARSSRGATAATSRCDHRWSVETWGGHPDLSLLPRQLAFAVRRSRPARCRPPRNWSRWSNPELDKIIEQIRAIAFDDPKGIELGQEFVKLAVQEMPIIPLMSYNVFTMMDETYWTGYPTAEDPYTNPVPNWGNSRYMMVRLKPTQLTAAPAAAGRAGRLRAAPRSATPVDDATTASTS